MCGVAASESGISGAMSAGMLNEAKIVMLSRRQKSVYEILGTCGTPAPGPVPAPGPGRAEGVGWHEAGGVVIPCKGGYVCDGCGCVGLGPKMRANRASLYTHIPIFTIVVVRNFAVPGKTVEKDLFLSVEETVSIVFAVR